MNESTANAGGIFATVKRVFKTLRDVAENRLELFLVELKEERIRLFDALFLLLAGVVCLLMMLIMGTLTLVVIFWETHRVLILGLATLAYGGAAVTAFARLRSRLQHWRAFSATLDQIKRDRACFEKTN